MLQFPGCAFLQSFKVESGQTVTALATAELLKHKKLWFLQIQQIANSETLA